jgi:hypothetical protein
MKSMNGAWLALGVAGAVAAAGVAMGRGGSRNDEDEDEDEMGSMAYAPNRRPVRRLAIARERDRRRWLARHAAKSAAVGISPYSDEAIHLDATGWWTGEPSYLDSLPASERAKAERFLREGLSPSEWEQLDYTRKR